MTRVRSKVAFSGVPKWTLGFAEHKGNLRMVTWEPTHSVVPETDWFDESEFKQYLEVLR